MSARYAKFDEAIQNRQSRRMRGRNFRGEIRQALALKSEGFQLLESLPTACSTRASLESPARPRHCVLPAPGYCMCGKPHGYPSLPCRSRRSAEPLEVLNSGNAVNLLSRAGSVPASDWQVPQRCPELGLQRLRRPSDLSLCPAVRPGWIHNARRLRQHNLCHRP